MLQRAITLKTKQGLRQVPAEMVVRLLFVNSRMAKTQLLQIKRLVRRKQRAQTVQQRPLRNKLYRRALHRDQEHPLH